MGFRQQEVDTQFFTPRTYQLELVEKAKQRNIIVPLGTGSGKTFIAVMLMKELASEVRVPYEKGGRRMFFLVEKVNLVKQQSEQIRCHTDFNVGEYHGRMNVDIWDTETWKMHLTLNQVIVLTAQVFWDMLNHGFFTLERANLLVFDECHHALPKGHPYRQIMKHYAALKTDGPRPRILGLTASVISSKTKPEKLEQLMLELECALHCSIETASDLVSVAKYGAKPKIFVIQCRDFDVIESTSNSEIVTWIAKALEFCRRADFHPDLDIDPTRPIIESFKRILDILKQLGPWCAWKVCQIWEKQLQKLNKHVMTDDQQLFIEMGLTYIRSSKRFLGSHVRGVKSLQDALKFLPNKVARLLDILKQFKPSKEAGKNAKTDEFSGIIFVEQRYVAYVMKVLLKSIIKWDPENYGFLNVDFVIGYSGYNLPTEEQMALHRRQEDVLKQFRWKKLNLLIATNVLEEGVDVRQCNVVIRFDKPKEYRSYVQSKGRARKAGSMYFILVEKSEAEKFSHEMSDFDKIEKILLRHCHCRDNPPAEEIDVNAADEMEEPYAPEPPPGVFIEGKPRITMSSAISLVNRYCAKLPSDIFTRLVPHCEIDLVEKDGKNLYRGSVLLPINSPVKPKIFGHIMVNKKFAQMSVALETCRVLHKRAELNHNLLPVGKESVGQLLRQLGDDTFEEWLPGTRARPGSTKRKQYYDKKVASAFKEAKPVSEQLCYIHVIELRLTKAATKETNPKNRRIVDPMDSPMVLGILSAKELPKIPPFSVFTRQGEVTVTISVCPSRLCVTADQLKQISQFHQYLFTEILRLDKICVRYQPDDALFSIFVIPLHKVPEGTVLDWKFINEIVKNLNRTPKPPPDHERRNFKMERENYVDAVVMPWYRNQDQPHFYYVAEICDHLQPWSNFPDDEFKNFNEYFNQKYGMEIYNQDQPLIDVDYTSGRLNLLTPRFFGRKGLLKSVIERPPVTSVQKQILVPELIEIHPIPASVWNMIVLMPSILYRLNLFLLADELRIRVEKEAFGREKELDVNFQWEPLDYGYCTKDIKDEENGGDGAESGYIVAESESYDKRSKDIADASKKAIVEQDADNFEIGIWDPSALDEGVWKSVQQKQSSQSMPVSDTVGLMTNGQYPLIDDFEEDDIMFDVEFSRHVMKYQNQAGSDQTKGKNPFQPTIDIEPIGWESEEVPNIPLGDCGGLQFLSIGENFNSASLMNDIASVEVGRDQQLKTTLPTDTKPVDETSSSVETTKNRAAQPTTAAPKMWLGTMDMMDDIDRRREEETVDLSDFDVDSDSEEGENKTIKSSNPIASVSSLKGVKICGENEMLDIGAETCDPVLPSEEELKELEPVESQLADATNSAPGTSLLPLEIEGGEEFSPFQNIGNNEQLTSFEADAADTNLYGPSPCLLLQALTMSNANDGINLERLETVGDSFLKYATTVYLFHTYRDMHEGKLSFMRSKQVSNFKLYALGKAKGIPELMVAAKFEPHDNWLPPGFVCPKEYDAINQENVSDDDKQMEDVLEGKQNLKQEVRLQTGWDEVEVEEFKKSIKNGVETYDLSKLQRMAPGSVDFAVLPYNMLTQQSIADKSVADSVEALIGVYLITYGPQGALKFMDWLGLRVVPPKGQEQFPFIDPLLDVIEYPEKALESLWQKHNFSELERKIGYKFRNRAFLMQAFTHASYYYNRFTDCYQRLEFLGDAVLDYMITRHLYEDKRQYSPGVLTDLRSALVNNTIFASLAIKHGFHKYFLALCPGLFGMIEKFVRLVDDHRMDAANFNEELYMVTEEEADEGEEEDIEVPKAMGDIFESVAGAVYLDSGCSLDTVWRVFFSLMKDTVEKCCANPPQSPIRELLELEPERAKFAKLERIIETGKVRVTVDVYNKCRFTGMGRNYRIAKCTAAKRALRHLKALKAQQARETAASVN